MRFLFEKLTIVAAGKILPNLISTFCKYYSSSCLLLCLCVKQKHFSNSILFFLFFIPRAVFARSSKSFLTKFRQFFLQTCVAKIGSPSFDIPANYSVYTLKFCVCKQDMLCALEIKSNGGFKQGLVKPCPSITANISAITMQMATKFSRAATQHEKLPQIKPHDLLITWSCKIT